MNIYPSRIQTLRRSLGLSQEELGFRVGTSQRQISKYERGTQQPTAGVLIQLAAELQTTTDYLLGLTDIPERPLRGAGDLDESEMDVIKMLRTKDSETKQKIIDAIKTLAG